jgi:hypothetical protein
MTWRAFSARPYIAVETAGNFANAMPIAAIDARRLEDAAEARRCSLNKPSFLELNATHLIDLDRANDVLSHGGALQLDIIETQVESAPPGLRILVIETRVDSAPPGLRLLA